MDLKLMFSTFVLIFFAELGDKTQLAALAAAAGARSTWSVFLGAAGALVLSTVIAVLVGDALSRAVPAHWIRGLAGLLFLVFGAILLTGAVRTVRAEGFVRHPVKPNALARLVLEMAATFEEASSADYGRLADQADAETQALFRALATEESEHLAQLRSALSAHARAPQAAEAERAAWPAPAALASAAGREALRAAVTHERTTAAFYRALAQSAPFASLGNLFLTLADQEEAHARRIEVLSAEG